MSITKIAAITGASVSTVARVLRDPEHKCHSMELKERILQTAREIGYVPNEAAKALKSGSAPKKIFHINILLTRVNWMRPTRSTAKCSGWWRSKCAKAAV